MMRTRSATGRLLAVERLEQHFGRPFRQVLADLYAEHRNMDRVAEALHQLYPEAPRDRDRLWWWMKVDGLSVRDLKAEIARRSDPTPAP